MRLVFAGTPEVALPSLDRILAAGHELCAVVTRPPAAKGRSRRLVPSPVAQWAVEKGIEVLTPPKASDPEFLARLAEIAPECGPVVAYGGLIPRSALVIPENGWVNLHFSLLPKYRGAAPVQRAIMAGERLTGATVFRLVPELDAGPVFGTITEPIEAETTSGELLSRLAKRGADLLIATLAEIEAGSAIAVEQEHVQATLAPKIEVAEARIDWNDSAEAIRRLVHGCHPAPGAWTLLAGQRFKVARVELLQPAAESMKLPPGDLAFAKSAVLVGTGMGILQLVQVQPFGKKPMVATDWARGLPNKPSGFDS